ncbi:MAG: hypothetical protein A3J24_02355 [Deltaproteobacteria bacterium RIFCSPLOWO2_02_FULL_53_8]|nr:MAG: hypothetical protein A3J24_02355 [Deltaproteobacteria bacterium RIFCSPLOWO2_02_FULL_53_8]
MHIVTHVFLLMASFLALSTLLVNSFPTLLMRLFTANSFKEGAARAANITIMATVTNNSINVKPDEE